MNVVAILLVSLIVGTMLKRSIKFLQASLIPTSVISGTILIIIAGIYKWITGEVMFDTLFFDGKGTVYLEVITYHALALGFIASTLKSSGGKLTKKRTAEIFNTGVTTVSTYLLQGVLGLGISIIAAMIIKGFFPAAGMLLPFGYGQGTGQALNYGTIYETENGFIGGKVFGLTIAAAGFLSAALGGVIHLNLNKSIRARRKESASECVIRSEEIQSANEIPMQESLDKLTVETASLFRVQHHQLIHIGTQTGTNLS
jgi:ESS family glutamate:Na+ symporter